MSRFATIMLLVISTAALWTAPAYAATCSQGMTMVENAIDTFQLDANQRYKAELLLRTAIIAEELGQERKCKIILGDIIQYYLLKEAPKVDN